MLEKITQQEINERSVSSLAVRPNDRSSYGSGGMTAAQVKERFDALSLLLIARYNALIDAVRGHGENGISSEIQTSIEEKTLEDIFRDIESGTFVGYLKSYSNEGELLDLQSIVNKLYELARAAQDAAAEALLRPCVDDEARGAATLAQQSASKAKDIALAARETADRALTLAGQGGGGGNPTVPPAGGEVVDTVARQTADEAKSIAQSAQSAAEWAGGLAYENSEWIADTGWQMLKKPTGTTLVASNIWVSEFEVGGGEREYSLYDLTEVFGGYTCDGLYMFELYLYDIGGIATSFLYFERDKISYEGAYGSDVFAGYRLRLFELMASDTNLYWVLSIEDADGNRTQSLNGSDVYVNVYKLS